MAGILDPKTRVLDFILTAQGRRTLAEKGEFTPAFISFADDKVYGGLPGDFMSGVRKFTNGLVDRVAFHNAFAPLAKEGATLNEARDIEEGFQIRYKDMDGYEGARRIELIGATHNILTSEISRLGRNILKFRSGGRFTEFDLNVALERLSEVETTLGVIEKNAMNIKLVKSQIFSGSTLN